MWKRAVVVVMVVLIGLPCVAHAGIWSKAKKKVKSTTGQVVSTAGTASQVVGQTVTATGQIAGDAVGHVSTTAGNAVSSASGAVGGVYTGAGSAVQGAGNDISD